MKAYRILLADDHPMFRLGLKRIIEQRTDFQIVGEAKDRFEVTKLAAKKHPDMIVLDISMNMLRGLETIRELKASYPKVKILILTMHRNIDLVYHAYRYRADGYLLKDETDEELFAAMSAIRSGNFYLSPLLSRELTFDFMNICHEGGKFPQELLTIREIQVMKLIAEGKSGKEIATSLFISPRTVEHHRAKIMKKLNLRKSLDLVKFAIKKGYV